MKIRVITAITAFSLNMLVGINALAMSSTGENLILSSFLALYPDYRVSSEPICSNSANHNSTTDLLFYSSTADVSILKIVVIPTKKPNAYALAKSSTMDEEAKIVLTQGLLDLIHTNSALAFVIAHEMAHLKAEHFLPDFSQTIFTSAQQKFFENITQNWELVADHEALQKLYEAGFEDKKAIKFLSSLAKHSETTDIPFLRNHPSLTLRINSLKLINRASINDHQNISMLNNK